MSFGGVNLMLWFVCFAVVVRRLLPVMHYRIRHFCFVSVLVSVLTILPWVLAPAKSIFNPSFQPEGTVNPRCQ